MGLPTTSLLRDAAKKQETNPDSKAQSHRREREKIKPRLCILPWAAAALGRLRHPPDSSTHKAEVYFLFVFPISQQQTRPVGKKRSEKTEGRRRGGGGKLTLCKQVVCLHEILILPQQGQS